MLYMSKQNQTTVSNKIVVVYYSLTGNAEYVADLIAKNINADVIRLMPKKEMPNKGFKKYYWGGKSAVMKETPELNDCNEVDSYDYIIIGTPVWAGTFTPPIRTFIKENKDILKNKKIAIFITYSGMGALKTIDKIKNYLGKEDIYTQLTLIDPNDKKNSDNDIKIKEFCEKVLKENN